MPAQPRHMPFALSPFFFTINPIRLGRRREEFNVEMLLKKGSKILVVASLDPCITGRYNGS